ncbi:hypothetical protein MUK42_13295 [Musa troglodytarum]|uniref:DRBM domain-containing protein n=1 Tax=Musa troglodytarum TaxID=320322 RepID=A0A9E7HJA8_9LILI|nr:hypothetical protein MUK42_13295 [Musa troglodytarum]
MDARSSGKELRRWGEVMARSFDLREEWRNHHQRGGGNEELWPQVYIRDELFDPTQFYALGRPCKMARGYKLKSKPLEDIVQSAKKERPKLIGYDEEPIVIDNLDSIPLEKLQIQITEETPHSLGLEKANDASTLNCSGNPCSSRMELTRADTSESCNGNNGQIQQTMSDYVEISGTSPGGNHTETTGTLAHKTAKSRLMEICATNHWGDPLFECCKEEGPSHLKMFTYKVAVEVQHESSVCLECFSEPKPQKKAAQDHAAEGALWYLKHIGYIL